MALPLEKKISYRTLISIAVSLFALLFCKQRACNLNVSVEICVINMFCIYAVTSFFENILH